MIGVSRRILESMLQGFGPSRLSHEVLSTFMCEVTAIVNACPLVPVSTDPEAPLILTPATLLTQKFSAVLPPPGEFSEKDLLVRQWRQVQSLANTFLESLAKGISHNLTKPQKMAELKLQPPSWRCCAAEKHSRQKE